MTREGMEFWNSPKLPGDAESRFGLMKFTLLNALNASARNCRRCPSHGRWNDLATAISKFSSRCNRSAARSPTSPAYIGSQFFAALAGSEKTPGLHLEL